MNTRDHGQCLTEETLTDYLEGGLDPPIKAASEVHLIACDDCRGRLGSFMRLLNRDVSSEEAVALKAISAQWDKKKATDEMPQRAGRLRGLFFAVAGIAAILIISLVSAQFVLDRGAEPNSASEVVQLLLAQQRPFELRLSNQPHLPLVRTRGANDSGLAYGLLAGEMTRLSADGHEMGRFYLLQKDFKRAIAYLEMAEHEVGASAEVHNDLGVAYCESQDESQTQKAAQEFQHALASNRTFAPAVFNLALFYERMGATSQAESQWRRYLELDPNSPWAMEARSRLKD